MPPTDEPRGASGPAGPPGPEGRAGHRSSDGRDRPDNADGPRVGRPAGGVYDWYRRGLALLDRGDAGAAAELLAHAHADEPESTSVREALARALYGAGRHAEAAAAFAALVEAHPGDDYARFGLGLSYTRLDRFDDAVEQLALAVAMRPDRREYRQALTQARATVRARADVGWPATGPVYGGSPSGGPQVPGRPAGDDDEAADDHGSS